MSTQRQLSGDYYSQFTSTIQIPNLAKEIKSVFRLSLPARNSQRAGHSGTAPEDFGDGRRKKTPINTIRNAPFAQACSPAGFAEQRVCLAREQEKFNGSGNVFLAHSLGAEGDSLQPARSPIMDFPGYSRE